MRKILYNWSFLLIPVVVVSYVVVQPTQVSCASLTLGKELGKGMEGAVYEIEGSQPEGSQPEVAKVINTERHPLGSPELVKQAAFDESRVVAGLPKELFVFARKSSRASSPELGEQIVQNLPKMDQDLAKLMEQIRESRVTLSRKEVLEIWYQFFLGLAVLHKHGVLHRDLKPSNILVNIHSDGEFPYKYEVKISDFGCATREGCRVLEPSAVGPLGYRAPEAFDQNTPYDERSEVYAAALICLEIANGGKPAVEVTNMAKGAPTVLYSVEHKALSQRVAGLIEWGDREGLSDRGDQALLVLANALLVHAQRMTAQEILESGIFNEMQRHEFKEDVPRKPLLRRLFKRFFPDGPKSPVDGSSYFESLEGVSLEGL